MENLHWSHKGLPLSPSCNFILLDFAHLIRSLSYILNSFHIFEKRTMYYIQGSRAWAQKNYICRSLEKIIFYNWSPGKIKCWSPNQFQNFTDADSDFGFGLSASLFSFSLPWPPPTSFPRPKNNRNWSQNHIFGRSRAEASKKSYIRAEVGTRKKLFTWAAANFRNISLRQIGHNKLE